MTMKLTTVHDYLMASATSGPISSASSRDKERAARLLLVDDEPKLLHSLHALLSDLPCHLSMATSGKEVLEKLSQLQFDLILLDLNLPDMHGHEIMDFIAARHIDATVVVLSGETRIDGAIGALKRGAYGYLRKPYAPEELLKTIDNVLKKRQLQAENRRISWQLKCSEELYRSLVNSSPDIIYILNADGRFTFANQRVQQLLGFSSDELIGKHYSYVIDESDLERAGFVFNPRPAGQDVAQNVELTFKCRKGSETTRVFENTLVPMPFRFSGKDSVEGAAAEEAFFGTYGVARDITERKRIDKLISYQAYHDILTGLPNRALFKDRLELALAHAKRHNTKLALVFFDLDRFKEINDSLGHMKGDELLQQVADRLQKRLRRSDTLARMGGDEFTIILPDLHHQHDAMALVEKFLKCLYEPFLLDDRELRVSGSIGVAVYPSDGQTMDDLLRHADIAMYQSKAAGRNTIRFFDPEMQVKVTARVFLEEEMRQGLEQNQFVLHYQPQADTNGRITGAEALIRWQHPKRGLIPPAEFIPMAEESGLILPLGQWVLETACAQIAKWAKRPETASLTIAVNVSARQFRHSDFVKQVIAALERSGANPNQLKIELTESLLLDNIESTIEKMAALKAKGVGFSLDDFGIGYSSLSYLKRLPLDQLKIDQSFVRDVLTDLNDATIARTIVTLARSLGLAVMAEGVETKAQQAFLANNGCQAYQGYLFSHPLPANQLEAFVLGRTSV